MAHAQVTVDTPANVNFGSLAVGSTSTASTLNFTVASGTKVSSISVLTLGQTGLDFATASGGTCTTGAYSAKTNCTVDVEFKPIFPGQRRGAVLFLGSGNSELAIAPLSGVGTGPQLIFQGAAPTTIATGMNTPLGMAIDGANNVYIADEDNARVLKITPGGTQSTVGSGLLQPGAVAIDGAGNVYIADPGNNAVYKVTPAGTQTTVLSSATTASYFGVAIDGAGNVFVTDADNGTITKISPTGTQTSIPASLAFPYEIAVDPSENLYVADLAANNVYEISAGGTQTTVAGQPNNQNFLQPAGVTLDGGGNLYVTAYGSGFIFQITPAGAINQLVGGLTYPVGVALDGAGNLYFSQDNLNVANKIDQADGPTLSFQTTEVEKTSSDSPQTITLQNIGPSTLNFSAFDFPADFPEATVADGFCLTATPLAAGDTCSLGIDFSPTGYAGSSPTMLLTESATVTSNTLNATTTQDITVSGTATKNGQTISFTPPTPVSYGTAAINLAPYASASSGLTVTFTLISGPATLSGTTLTITAMGSVVVQANQAGEGAVAPATPVQKTIVVNPAVLTVTATAATKPFDTANPTFAYTIGGYVNGDMPSVVTGAPTLTTTATLTSTAGVYPIVPAIGTLAAPNYSFSFVNALLTVVAAMPVIDWANPAPITYPAPLTATQLNAGTIPAGTFVYTPPAGTILSAGTHTLSTTWTPSSTLDYTSTTATATIVVNQAKTNVSWTAPSPISYGTALSGTQLNATSTLPGTFAYSPASGSVLTVGTHTLSVTFTPTDSVDYATATTTVSITVNVAGAPIAWPPPAAIPYGTALSATQLDATSTAAGTYVYTPAAGTMLPVGMHTLSVTFTPTDTTDYSATTISVPITVNQAKPAITWAAPAAITYGTALSGAQLNASSPVAGTLVYSPASGAVLTAGSQTLSVTLNPTDTVDYISATATVPLTVNKVTPAITWAAPAAVGYGTALGATQLDATASVAGTLSYTPTAGALLTAGTHTLSVTCTPTDTVDYASTTTTVSLTVNQAKPILTWGPPAAISYGTKLSATQLDAIANVAGASAYTPGAGSVPAVGTQTLSVTFTPTDAVDYTTATASVTIVVGKALPVITWATPKAITYGDALSATQLDAGASVAGAFVYSPVHGTVLGAGSHELTVTFTPTNTTDYASNTAKVALDVKAAPLTLTATNEKVAYGKAIPALKYTVTGLVNKDTTAVLSGKVDETTTAKLDSPVGTYKIDLTRGTLKAANYTFAFKDGTLTITSLGTAATPKFKPAAGTYSSSQSVTITDATAGAVIYYTVNGSTPATSSTKYTKAISVKATETVKAIAVAKGFVNSAAASAKFTIN
jgi:sugar lactone lactonase YvrE